MWWTSDRNMANWNKNVGYGRGLVDFVRTIVPTFGNILVVLNSANSDEANYHHVQEVFTPDPDGLVRFYTTVKAAYDAAESNNNDVILLDANSSHSNAMITVSKNRIHFIGMDGGGRRNSQGAKLITPADNVAASVAVIKNTGTRNSYRNIKFTQNGTNTAQVSAFEDSGEGTYVKNCQMEVNSILGTKTQALLFRGDTCHYEDCQIGNSTVYHTTTYAPLVIKTTARYSYFINCTIIAYSNATASSCIDVPDANGIIGWLIFENCGLISAKKGDGSVDGGTMVEAVTSATTSGYLYFRQCSSFQATSLPETHASILSDAPSTLASAAGGEATKAG